MRAAGNAVSELAGTASPTVFLPIGNPDLHFSSTCSCVIVYDFNLSLRPSQITFADPLVSDPANLKNYALSIQIFKNVLSTTSTMSERPSQATFADPLVSDPANLEHNVQRIPRTRRR